MNSNPNLSTKMIHNVWQCKEYLDQYQYLGNCPPTPPLTLICYQLTVVELGQG